ncbi:diacylglycerol kinase [Intrasporangium oryzae NRRL B-24470]|uniref:Diacylglycerol kinase n=1 Tax=Intrasporangium oryzae NRRL B-24470 TaxID=1386089 RepID=W9GC95_9MICO|nr:diacylglycerol kinase family protein [Intrasporangium oryzae]EWT02438.1 diacylglycerol kinase [Intrasporangium oryzae NRRL B-24470]
MLKDQLPWIVLGIVVVVLVVAGIVLSRVDVTSPVSLRRRVRPHRGHFRNGEVPPADLKQAAIVINPTKFTDQGPVRERIAATCRAVGWGEPLFYETTAEDPGRGQAMQAVKDGAKVVCSLGGDGTVRHVASGLVGTETPLGILPGGTGNLLARNLDLPVDAFDTAMTVALTGRNRRIDVGELVLGDTDRDGNPVGPSESHYFLVISGIGMDAAIMAGTNENLKSKVGWAAYMLSGVKSLVSPEFRTTIRLDTDPEFRRRARGVMIGNCGRLLGGLVLMPNARVDDNQLDVVIASPKGVVGWVPVATRVLTRQRKGHPTLDQRTCQEVRVRVDRPLPVQVDGDVVGEATEVNAIVRPGVLSVRVSAT